MNTKKNKKSLKVLEKWCPKCSRFSKLRVLGWKSGNSFHVVTVCPCREHTFRWSDHDIEINWEYAKYEKLARLNGLRGKTAQLEEKKLQELDDSQVVFVDEYGMPIDESGIPIKEKI